MIQVMLLLIRRHDTKIIAAVYCMAKLANVSLFSFLITRYPFKDYSLSDYYLAGVCFPKHAHLHTMVTFLLTALCINRV